MTTGSVSNVLAAFTNILSNGLNPVSCAFMVPGRGARDRRKRAGAAANAPVRMGGLFSPRAELRFERGIRVRRAGRTVQLRHFISTMAIRNLVRAFGADAPAPVRAAGEGLKYRDFLVVALMVDREDLFPDNWIYVHTPGVQVSKVIGKPLLAVAVSAVGRFNSNRAGGVKLIAWPPMSALTGVPRNVVVLSPSWPFRL